MPIDDDPTQDSAARELDRARDGATVARLRSGDPDAFGELYDVWFDRVFNVVLRIVRDQDTAAEVTQDAFASAWRNLDGLDDPSSFGGWLLRIGRNAALNRAKREARSTSIDQDGLAMIEQHGGSPTSAPPGFDIGAHLDRFDDPAAAVGDAQIVALVREAAAALGPRDAEVLDLQLRYQLTPAEVGQVLDLNRNAANQLCHRVRARFAGAFGARVLWGNGQPTCAALQAELSAAGVDHFGTDAVPLIARHADECLTCGEDRRTRLSPAALFASIPLVPVLLSVRSGVAHGLAASGVPMQGSRAASMLPTGGATDPAAASAVNAAGPPAPAPLVTGPPPASSASSRFSRRAIAAAIAAAAVLVTAFLLIRDADGSARRVAAGPDSTSSALAGRAPSGPSTTMHDLEAATSLPGVTAPPIVVRPTTPTTPRAPTTSPPAPTTTIPPITVDHFAVVPDTPQPAVYAVATGPVLTWSVSHAADVTIWVWFDDGVHGDRRVGVVSTGASGSRPLCPGSHPTPESCTAASGHYRYELVATAEDGSTFTDPTSPGFDVLPPVIT